MFIGDNPLKLDFSVVLTTDFKDFEPLLFRSLSNLNLRKKSPGTLAYQDTGFIVAEAVSSNDSVLEGPKKATKQKSASCLP